METSSITTPFPEWVSVPSSVVSLFIFYILSYLLSKMMGCFSGRLMSSASDQKLFCEVRSAFKCSFDEFVGEKVVSPSYSCAIFHNQFLFPSFLESSHPQLPPLLKSVAYLTARPRLPAVQSYPTLLCCVTTGLPQADDKGQLSQDGDSSSGIWTRRTQSSLVAVTAYNLLGLSLCLLE